MRRIVIKIGSKVLTRPDGTLDVTRMSSLVDQMVGLIKSGYQILVVTSGAVACGRSILRPEHQLDSVEQRQLFSAVGQVRLIDFYSKMFREYGLRIGQILTTKRNFESGVEYQNQRGCIEVMLENGVVPVINENDTVSVTELMFTDNDELSGLVAKMVGAEVLVILSGVDGVYRDLDNRSGLIPVVHPGDDISGFIVERRSRAGRGGMVSKYQTASELSASGIRVFVADGKRENVLTKLIDAPQTVPHTEFATE